MKHLKCYHTLLSILLLLGCLASCDVRQEEEEDNKLTPLVIKQINEGSTGSLTSLTLWKVKTPTFKVTYTYGRGQWVASPRPFYVEEITTKEQFVAMHTPADTEKDAVTGLTDIRVAGPSTVATNGILELDFHSLMAQVTIKLKNSDVDLKGAILSTPALYQTYTLNGIELTPSGDKTQYNAALSSSSLLILPQDIAGEWSVTLPNGKRYSCTVINTVLAAGKSCVLILEEAAPAVKVESIEFNKTNISLGVGRIKSLIYTVLPENATNKSLTWSSSDPAIATVNATTGKVEGKAVGQVIITATANDGSDVKGTCQVTVEKELITWATGSLVAKEGGGCKIGAPGDHGLYFQFGSLIGWSGGANGDGTGIAPNGLALEAKAIPNGYEGTPSWNNNWTGDPATENVRIGTGDPCKYYLGGTWRLPTSDEYEKMFDDWDWDDSSKSATISGLDLVFPASGFRTLDGGSLKYVGVQGEYWSASRLDSSWGYALYFLSSFVELSATTQAVGHSVRCVRNSSN